MERARGKEERDRGRTRKGRRVKGREIGGGRASIPRIRHMLPPLLLLLYLPSIIIIPPHRSRFSFPLRSLHLLSRHLPLSCRRKSRCAGEASRESNRFASKLADHYVKLAKCDATRSRDAASPAADAVAYFGGNNLRDERRRVFAEARRRR